MSYFLLVIILNNGDTQFFKTQECERLQAETEILDSVQSATCIPYVYAEGELI